MQSAVIQINLALVGTSGFFEQVYIPDFALSFVQVVPCLPAALADALTAIEPLTNSAPTMRTLVNFRAKGLFTFYSF